MELHFPNYAGNDIVYRTGSATPIELPKMERIVGDINTLKSFVEKRYQISTPEGHGLQFIDKDRALVTVNRESFTILLEVDPEHPRGLSVLSKLELAPELLNFCIDVNKVWTRDELVKFLKRQKIWFQNSERHEALLKALMALSANVTADMGNSSDFRGNVDNTYKKTVTSNIPESFSLNIPIFKGQPKKVFTVDICIEGNSAGLKFWFESVELSNLIIIESELILKAQLECCNDFVIVWE